MRRRLFWFAVPAVLAFLAACHTTKQSTTLSDSIVGKHWKLIELNGKPIQVGGQLRRESHLTFNASEKRVNGNTSCNSFFGSYELQGDNGLTFSKMGATKMACPDDVMDVERQVFQAFEKTNKFSIKSDTLYLNGSDMSLLAKYVASTVN